MRRALRATVRFCACVGARAARAISPQHPQPRDRVASVKEGDVLHGAVQSPSLHSSTRGVRPPCAAAAGHPPSACAEKTRLHGFCPRGSWVETRHAHPGVRSLTRRGVRVCVHGCRGWTRAGNKPMGSARRGLAGLLLLLVSGCHAEPKWLFEVEEYQQCLEDPSDCKRL